MGCHGALAKPGKASASNRTWRSIAMLPTDVLASAIAHLLNIDKGMARLLLAATAILALAALGAFFFHLEFRDLPILVVGILIAAFLATIMVKMAGNSMLMHMLTWLLGGLFVFWVSAVVFRAVLPVRAAAAGVPPVHCLVYLLLLKCDDVLNARGDEIGQRAAGASAPQGSAPAGPLAAGDKVVVVPSPGRRGMAWFDVVAFQKKGLNTQISTSKSMPTAVGDGRPVLNYGDDAEKAKAEALAKTLGSPSAPVKVLKTPGLARGTFEYHGGGKRMVEP
jgi:hypothetical protein